jgi:hypothetical protein
MATRSVFEELDNQGAILNMLRDQVLILRPHDSKSAVGTQRFDGHACLVLMETSPRSAVVMAHFDCYSVGRSSRNIMLGNEGESSFLTEVEVNYMSMLRKAVKLLLDEHDLFRPTLAWVVLRHHDNPALSALLQEKTLKIFQHLRIQTGVSVCNESIKKASSLQPPECKVFAVRSGTGVPEIHVGDDLVYPKCHSRSLTPAFAKPGAGRVDNEREDCVVPRHYNWRV